MDRVIRVAVVGAGCSGLAAVKNCLARGLDVVCFEANDDIGGNWIYSEQPGHSSVCETTHLISSRSMSAYLDFPMPEAYPDYPSHDQVLRYFRAYADRFRLRPHIRFRTRVTEARLLADGRWQIATDAGDPEVFDFLLTANGHHHAPRHPEEVRSAFTGRYLHSHAYKHNRSFAGERVLVIGGGNSGCDCAVEISRVAARTDISIRRPHYILPKFFLGRPVDTFNERLGYFPKFVQRALRKLTVKAMVGDYRLYGLEAPTVPVTSTHPTLNSELLYKIRHGKVQPRRGIADITGRRVTFTDGKKSEYDTIVAATGYRITFPFLDQNLIDYERADRIPLYLRMFRPDYPTLLFIGLFQPQGAIWPLADAQSRLAAAYMAGTYRLPKDLRQRAEADSDRIERDFQRSKRHTIEVHYHAFMHRLERELGNS
ncbi:cation diffusion facilitator CzcD-associated flavoprotein CzcO [Neolewinella xylanilytica]|uniref:Cation diffusion facilitator CzcD-associated flavoprotein CzcO n=1 Tax=Neolewinella xylanilytica TaxID=1514080 RepID=A0A2S6I6T9_9BACT|nr:NAD(P)-binding domain-containing protein [Neolewinella xylanilytica]PPK87214.1 cation diffusion facilitator CzcD-associated flavoprotein CzcO [Neolewinella xylanilytica]